MKITLVVLFFIVCCWPIHAAETNLTLTVDGVTYSNVVFGTVTPYAVSVRHSTGAASIPLAKLPADLQQRFGYDPEKAAWQRKAELEAAERIRQADAAARARREGNERQAALDAATAASAVLVRATVIQALPNGAIVTLERPNKFPDGSQFWSSENGECFILGIAIRDDTSDPVANGRADRSPGFALPKLSGIYDGSTWTGYIIPSGDYEYTTVQGAYKKVPRYRLKP